ncbi:DUF4114 domain-containing protein [Thalassococcus profundi]|uniref:DUF4114 domain-containing protein n=1 Tax=Thalassococcus profundi TaxID=2282382 RepID=A0A369TV16_9RHOB|nr:DUF4114 domain-containing protein [Thalassococcus profundi]RDD66786.1 DUF4114 domain-containing protein [Thalassococcus profundi]
MFDEDFAAKISFASQEAADRITTAIAERPELFAEVFGTRAALESVLGSWAVSGVPTHGIDVVPASRLPGADAGYSADLDVIYLSDAMVAGASMERLVDVLIEELGHRLDAALGGDGPGDEGEALAVALRGEPVPQTEDDGGVLVLSGGGDTAIEQTTSVSDSGGFEGSSQTLQLESTNGSEISYSYTHFTIPDRFIIRYEGRNIVDTGFTGGSRSGTVQLPAGTADTVQVIVATDDAGTAWNYSVTAEPIECDDVRPWTITADQEFEHNDDTDKCETTGDVRVGRIDGATTLITARSTSKAAYDQDVLEVKGGQVFSGIGGVSERLFTADFNLNLNNGIASLSNVTQGDFKLAGIDIEFKGMAILSDKLAFDARFIMPDPASGLIIETVDFFSQAIRITDNGAAPVLGFRIAPPGSQEFKLGGFIDVKASNMALEYRAGEDAFRFQAKLEFTNTNFAKGSTGISKVEADLSGMNYIQVNTDGDVDVIGVLKAAGNVPLFGGWSIQGLEFNINTTTREVGGAGTLGTPFGVKFGEGATARAEVEFVYDPFELDKIGLILDNLNKPIPAYPAFFFQRIGGSVDNFAPSNNKDVEGNFTIGASLGPQIAGTSLAKATFDAKVTSKFFQGQMTTDILTANFTIDAGLFDVDLGVFTLVKDVSTAKLDWNKGELSFTGTTNVLDGFFVTTGSFKANADFDFSMARSGQLSLPNFVPVYGGAKIANSNLAINYTNNGTSSDDYAAGWGQYTVNTPWDSYNITLGLRINFDGSIARIGANNIPTTSSWFIEDGQDFVILSAIWENADSDVAVRVIKPDGTIIEEADFAANQIMVIDEFSGDNSRSVIIDAPEEGTWDLEIVDTTGLGNVQYEATGAVEVPEFDFTGTPQVNADGTVTFAFDASTTTPVTNVSFFYDDDLTEMDGLLAGTQVLADGSGEFTWDANTVVPGSYFLYAMVDDGQGPIVFAETATAVDVGAEADLSVTIEASAPEVQAGDQVTLTIVVTNTSTDTTATGTRALLNVDAGVTATGGSEPLNPSDVAQYEIDVGDLAPGEERTITVDTTVGGGAAPGDQFAADVYVLSDTYDPETVNDGAATQVIVPNAPVSGIIDLSVDSKIDEASNLTINTPFTYTVTVSNNGTTDATNVVLEEAVQGLTNLSATPTNGFFSGGAYRIQLGTIAAGDSIDVEITATPASAGLLLTTSRISADGFDQGIADNEEINVGTVQGATPDEADLSVALRDATVTAGTTNVLEVDITNDGPGVASDVQVQLSLPAGATVDSSSAVQGSYDATTGIWSLGNLRDNLTRTLSLTIAGLGGQEITAEVVAVSETDPDSTPGDGEGDDFATIDGLFGGLSGLIEGTDDDDVLTAVGTDDTINAGDGDDILRPGGGIDEMTGGPGQDQFVGRPQDLDGDTIQDLTPNDTLVVEGVTFGADDVTLVDGPPPAIEIDTDGDGTSDTTILLGSAPDGPGGFLAWQRGADTRLTFQQQLADIGEARALAAEDVNGIANQDLLTGDGTASFEATIDARAAAAFDNVLGVYEVDASGAISDVRILANDASATTGALAIGGVEAGNTLGFFIIQDGADIAEDLLPTDTLIFVDDTGAAANAEAGAPIILNVNGTAVDAPVFHSYAAELNADGVQHAISGLSEDGSALIIGFEDLVGGGDRDYQDVLFSIEIL